jgi:hypothetical protein
VQTYDQKPKRRLFDVLAAHGMQANQQVTFLTDGGEGIRELPRLRNMPRVPWIFCCVHNLRTWAYFLLLCLPLVCPAPLLCAWVAPGRISCMHTVRRGDRVLGLGFWAGLLALLSELLVLVIVLVTQGVDRASRWAPVLGTGLAITSALVPLVMKWRKQRAAAAQPATSAQVARAAQGPQAAVPQIFPSRIRSAALPLTAVLGVVVIVLGVVAITMAGPVRFPGGKPEFPGVAPERIVTLEDGTHDRDIVQVDQPKDQPVGIKFTQDRRILGGLTLLPFPTTASSRCERWWIHKTAPWRSIRTLVGEEPRTCCKIGTPFMFGSRASSTCCEWAGSKPSG